MANAIKNWEAQARTNSILAGSLKALEERVDDIAVLLSWRNEMDLKFEKLLGEVSGLENRIDSNDIFRFQENQSAFMANKTPGMDATSPSQVDASGNVPIKDNNFLRRMAGGVPPGAKVVHPNKWTGMGFLLHHGFMLLAGILLLVSLTEVRDISSKILVVVLALFCLGSVGLGLWVALVRTSNLFTLYLAHQQLILVLAAVFFQRGLDEAVKTTQFCDLKGASGIPDADCDFREFTSSMRVFLCALVIISTVLSSIIAIILKDEIVRAEIHNGVEINLPSLLLQPLSQAVDVTKSLALEAPKRSTAETGMVALPAPIVNSKV